MAQNLFTRGRVTPDSGPALRPSESWESLPKCDRDLSYDKRNPVNFYTPSHPAFQDTGDQKVKEALALQASPSVMETALKNNKRHIFSRSGVLLFFN